MNLERDKAYPLINALECKSCGRCVAACPKKVLRIGDKLNERGYHYVVYAGSGCIGCNNCFYDCPEPNAISVHVPRKA
ncbi:MAG: 4Fe-4S dicluster domain-containing protein [Oligosphaeraceae bacterium]|nr:4Fe-4S dicluster domain-containing protein [Oligosphaeraceae bacterium]